MLEFWIISSIVILVGGFVLLWKLDRPVTVGILFTIPFLAACGPVTIGILILAALIHFWDYEVIKTLPKPKPENNK